MMSAPFINLRSLRTRMVPRNTPIAAGFEDCLQLFEQLISAMEADSTTWKPAEVVPLKDDFSRVRAWGNDTGASSRSLDHALRKASKLQQQVSDLLDELRDNIQKALEIVRDAAVLFSPPIKLSEDVEYFNILPRQGHPATPYVGPSEDRLSQFMAVTVDVSNSIECILAMSPALEDPAPEDTFHRDASPSEALKDIALAEHMFPKASKTLLERLGHANWKRRQYQRELRKKRALEVSMAARSTLTPAQHAIVDVGGLGFQPVQGEPRSTSSGDLHRPNFSGLSLRGHRDIFNHLTSSDTGPLSNSETVFSLNSMKSYFETLANTSVDESDEPTKVSRHAIPKPPMTLEPGKTFLCHYCLHEILVGDDITTLEDWTDHVFLDLEPYMCTADEKCPRADKTYAVKGEWFSHELSHRLVKVWFCQSCKLEYNESENLELHWKEKHDDNLTPEQLKMMLPAFERLSQKQLVDEPCSLCGQQCLDAEMLKDHTASHLEHLALTSIESDDGTDDDAGGSRTANTTGYSRSAEIEAKKELLNFFLADQQQKIFATEGKDGNDMGNNGTTDSDPGFLGDSDDEDNEKPIIEAVEKVPDSTRPRRPGLKRHGETFLSKVEDFLEKQAPVDFETISALGTPAELLQDPFNAIFQNQPSRTVRTMPPPRNEGFVGRQSDLAKLYKELSLSGHTCILSGAGGMGKSATAIEYTYQFEETYAYIFWVLAETPVGCADSYSRIATHLVKDTDEVPDQDRLVTLSREFLEQTEERWLVVFDNVDELVDLQQYLPRNLLDTKGSVLITTRKMDLGQLTAPSNYARIELSALNLDDSRRLLLSSAGTSFDDIKKHPEYNVAGQIATFAEQLPLALSSIAGFVEVSGCSLADFVELWKESQRHTTFHQSAADVLASSTDRALEIVWNIGLREVTIDARELLNILAFLDSDTIQKDLLVGEHSEPSLEILHSSEAFRYKRMTSELSRRRLIAIRKREGEEILSIHRSLQAKILQDLQKDPRQREKVFSQAFLLVRKRFPLPSPIQVPTPDAWPACLKYLRHVLSFRKIYVGNLITIDPTVELARLLSDGGINLWERGMTSEGLQLLRSAEDMLRELQLNIGSSQDMLKANIHVIVALLLQDNGLAHLDESKDRIWQALQIRKDYQTFTPPDQYTRNDDILLHNAWSDYGCVLLQYNKYKDAEPIFRHCLRKYKAWGPEETIPYEHAKYNHHMAFCKMYRQQFEEAIALGERGLHFVILATGEKSASANGWKFDLACIVLQSGDIEKALGLHKEVLDARIQQHGKSSFLTLQSYYAVGALQSYLGETAQAEAYMRDALALDGNRRDSYPEAAVARTEFHLSQIMRERGGDVEEADALAARARGVLGRLLPLNRLVGVLKEHELALFDHIQPVFDGRFTGRQLLYYVS